MKKNKIKKKVQKKEKYIENKRKNAFFSKRVSKGKKIKKSKM